MHRIDLRYKSAGFFCAQWCERNPDRAPLPPVVFEESGLQPAAEAGASVR